MGRILIVSSNIHQEISRKQLNHCVEIVEQSQHHYQTEIASAGAYEIPFIINAYQNKKPFDAYIALGIILKTDLNHYDFIISHIKNCFTHFALNQIVVGNGIISGSSIEELTAKVDHQNPCISGYHSAFNAVDYLINLKNKLNND